MKKLGNRMLAIGLISTMLVFTTACNTWPTIIAVAQSASAITSVFYPSVGALSSLAVNLLQQAEAAYNTYEANKNEGNAAAYVAVIQQIETELPADLNSLNIPLADQTKVSAVVTIILDFVEAEAAQVPASAKIVTDARMARVHRPVPKPMTKKQIIDRWQLDVCRGDQHCNSLVK
jgi:hypothetical protein